MPLSAVVLVPEGFMGWLYICSDFFRFDLQEQNSCKKSYKKYVLTTPFLPSVCRRGKCQTDHVLLTDRGANLFAESIGMATVPPESLVTDDEREEWLKHKAYATVVKEDVNARG